MDDPPSFQKRVLRIGLFVGYLEDIVTIKRSLSFSETGCIVTLFGFVRDQSRLEAIPPVRRIILLGAIKNRRYFLRGFAMVYALAVLIRNRHNFRTCNRFYARNLDMALLLLCARLLLWHPAPFTYEVLDIVPSVRQRSLVGAVMRFLERLVLKHCSELVVSSRAFVDGYFRSIQNYHGRWALVENKLRAEQVNGVRRPSGGDPLQCKLPRLWRVGWFGTLRSEHSLRSLVGAANALDGGLSIEIRGIFSSFSKTRAMKVIESSPYMHYHGSYNAISELPSLYRKIDFMWCGDIGINNPFNDQLLLPNRLYEAAYFGVPLIGRSGSETSKRIAEDDLGWVLPTASAEELVRVLKDMTEDEYRDKVVKILSLPESRFIETDDIANLVDSWASRPSV